ncbi:hypothetical protein, partial [Klebsiella pneumoniae]
GITELTDDEAEVQRAALARSERIIVIADGSKIGAATSSIVGPADRVTTLITDPSASPSELAALRDQGVQIVVATSDGRG